LLSVNIYIDNQKNATQRQPYMIHISSIDNLLLQSKLAQMF